MESARGQAPQDVQLCGFPNDPIGGNQAGPEAMEATMATFTADILECFTGALRRFMAEAGHAVPNEIHCVTPLPMDGHPGRKMRNHM